MRHLEHDWNREENGERGKERDRNGYKKKNNVHLVRCEKEKSKQWLRNSGTDEVHLKLAKNSLILSLAKVMAINLPFTPPPTPRRQGGAVGGGRGWRGSGGMRSEGEEVQKRL